MKVIVPFIISFFLVVFSNQTLWAQSQSELNIRLLQAAKNNSSDSVKYWLDKGADINYADENGFGALHFSISFFNNELCEYLITEGASVNAIGQKYIAPIFSVAGKGNLHAGYLLYKNGANINIKSTEGLTPFNYAEKLGYLRVAQFLNNPDNYSQEPTFGEYFAKMNEAYLKKNYGLAYFFADSAYEAASSELNPDNPYFISIEEWMKKLPSIALYGAAAKNQTDSVKYWVEKGGDVNYLDENGNTALLQAIAYYNDDLVQFIIKKGAIINTRTDITTPPIIIAAIKGNLRACYLLWKNCADLSVTDTDNKTTAYDYAIQNGYLRIAEFLKNTYSYSNESTFQELCSMSTISRINNEFEKAVNYAIDAYQRSKIELSEFCKGQIDVLNNIILAYVEIRDLENQLKYYQELVNVQKAVNGDKSLDYFHTLLGMGRVYDELGYYHKAKELYNRLFKLAEVYLDQNDPFWYSIFNNQGSNYLEIGDFSKAEEKYIQALRLSEKHKNEYNIAISSNNLASLYSELGKYKKAEELFIRTVEIRKRILGENNVLYAITLNNLAAVWERQCNYTGVKELYEKALEIISNSIGEDNHSYATTLNNYANILSLFDDNNADSIFKKSVEIQKKVLGTSSSNYAISLGNLAVRYYKKENYKEAIKLNLEAIENLSNNLVSNHPLLLTRYDNLSLAYFYSGDLQNSFFYFQKSFEIFKSELNSVFIFSSNASRNDFFVMNNNVLDGYKTISFNASKVDKSYSGKAFDIELLSNSILLTTMIEIRQAILDSRDSVLINDFNSLTDLRNQINYLQFQPENQDEIFKLEEKADSLDKLLTKGSQVYQKSKINFEKKWQDVQKGLKDDEAAVQFISFPYYNKTWTDSILYCALVVKPGMEYPAMIPLFEQKQLDSVLVTSYSSPDVLYASRGTKFSYNNLSTSITQSGNELYNLIWKPIEKELNGVKRVYYSPSGTLHQIAFAAMPVDSAQLLSDRYHLYQLTSTRQLATTEWKNQHDSITSASLFGGITYDMDESELSKLKKDSTEYEFIFSRSFTPDSSQRSTSFSFLAGSNEEVQTIASLFKEKRIPVSLYSGNNGDEATFKNLSNQDINVLHIATHGFFFPVEREKPTDFERLQFIGEQKFRYVPNPLLRSGLLLAGGNSTWKGETIPGTEDGILTAQEISEMNLSNTDLVVLSACETGLGDINNSEGVFGLQRAFKLAGVNTIIMSLWKVPDQQTSMLMQSFYKHWLNGMSKHDAFRAAQKEVRQVYPGAYYWAGFVMVD